MGARLIGQALHPRWCTLDTDAQVVLLAMALTARDTATQTAQAGRYWGGHDYLANVLTGRDLDAQGRADAAALQAVKRTVRKLREAGAVRVVVPAHRGRQAVYELTLDDPNQDALPVDNVVALPNKGDHEMTPKKVTR